MNNNELAWKIYKTLQMKGAIIGNASVSIIEEVLDTHDEEKRTKAEEELIIGIRGTNLRIEEDDIRMKELLDKREERLQRNMEEDDTFEDPYEDR